MKNGMIKPNDKTYDKPYDSKYDTSMIKHMINKMLKLNITSKTLRMIKVNAKLHDNMHDRT